MVTHVTTAFFAAQLVCEFLVASDSACQLMMFNLNLSLSRYSRYR